MGKPLMIALIILIPLAILIALHPIWCIVDCAIAKNRKTSSKIIWIIAMLIVGWIVPVIYGIGFSTSKHLKRLSLVVLILPVCFIFLIFLMKPQIQELEFKKKMKRSSSFAHQAPPSPLPQIPSNQGEAPGPAAPPNPALPAKPEPAVQPQTNKSPEPSPSPTPVAPEEVAEAEEEQEPNPMVDLLNDSDWVVRRDTAKTLGDIGLESDVPHLRKLLKDTNIQVRATAARAIKKIQAK